MFYVKKQATEVDETSSTDPGLSSSVNLTVVIEDVDDQFPRLVYNH